MKTGFAESATEKMPVTTGRSSLVSAIVPCLNMSDYLAACLQSLIAQTHRPLEIIVIDDGSTDNSCDVVKRLGSAIDDGLIFKYFWQRTSGAPMARNLGSRVARGEFLQFLDADDLLCPSKIADQVRLLESRPEVGVAYGDAQYLLSYRGSPERLGETIALGTPSDLLSRFLEGGWLPIFSYLCRREAVKRSGPWDSTLKINQDFDYFLRIAIQQIAFCYCPGLTGYYRKHSASTISEQSAGLRARARCTILRAAETMLRADSLLTPERRRSLAENYRRVARSIILDDPVLADEAINSLFSACPGFKPANLVPRLLVGAVGLRTYEWMAANVARWLIH